MGRYTSAAGPGILEECRAHGGCATGDAKITSAGRLAAQYIIHAVGPVWRGGSHRESELLSSCYERSIALAAAHGCTRVALPAISTGAFGYPLEQAAQVSLAATQRALEAHESVRDARFWLFDQFTFDVFADRLARITDT